MLVFISHNKADKPAAREIALHLVAQDVQIWLDEWEIAAGESIIEKINDGLRDCTHFIILWSKNSARSDWVHRELYSTLSRAISNRTLRVIPVILDDTPLPELMNDILYLQYTGSIHDTDQIVESVIGHKPSQDFLQAFVQKYRGSC